jgi:hypothetical protein
MKGLFTKYEKSDWKSDDFGRGKNKTSKSRHRRAIKKKAKNIFEKDLGKELG